MTQDFISALRQAQHSYAQTLTLPFWAHVGRTIAAEPGRLAEFLDPIVAADGGASDPEAVRISYEREAERQLSKAVEGFTDWAAARIVRSGDYDFRDFPIPSIVDVLTVTSEYDVKQGVLAFVRERMSKDGVVPLLGKVEAGNLVPDEAALKEWASFYDWSDEFEQGS